MNSATCKGENKSEMLSEAQKLMLQLSEEDTKAGKLVSQELVNEADFEWLKTLCF